MNRNNSVYEINENKLAGLEDNSESKKEYFYSLKQGFVFEMISWVDIINHMLQQRENYFAYLYTYRSVSESIPILVINQDDEEEGDNDLNSSQSLKNSIGDNEEIHLQSRQHKNGENNSGRTIEVRRNEYEQIHHSYDKYSKVIYK